MRIPALIAALLLAACGNWSNDDLEYLYALPQKDTLKSQLTSMGNTAQQPLLAGDPSKTYDDAKNASGLFNDFIDGVLGGLDAIRAIPPTRRDENGRWWGPFPDQKNPGFDMMIEIHREPDMTYTWSIKMRPRNGAFVTVGGGTFKPTVSLRKGQGTFFFDVKAANTLLMQTPKAGDPDRADFGYATDTDPVIVNIDFQFGGAKTAAYEFNGFENKSAVLSWLISNPGNPNASKVSFAANWNPQTAGRAEWLVLEGTWAMLSGQECWDEAHLVVFADGYDENGHYRVGDETKCIARVDPLPLP